jgi:AcrR family transcriptional regulator
MTKVNFEGEPRHPPQQPRSLRTREAILVAARAMAAAEGLRALRADRLAQSAGVAKGTIFAHFPEMEYLMATLLAERLAQLPGLGQPDSPAQLVQALLPLLRFMVSDARTVPVLARFSGPEGAGLAIDRALCALGHDMAQAIACLQASHKAADGDPGLLSEGLLAFAVHAAAASQCGTDPASSATAFDAARDVFQPLALRWLLPNRGEPA